MTSPESLMFSLYWPFIQFSTFLARSPLPPKVQSILLHAIHTISYAITRIYSVEQLLFKLQTRAHISRLLLEMCTISFLKDHFKCNHKGPPIRQKLSTCKQKHTIQDNYGTRGPPFQGHLPRTTLPALRALHPWRPQQSLPLSPLTGLPFQDHLLNCHRPVRP